MKSPNSPLRYNPVIAALHSSKTQTIKTIVNSFIETDNLVVQLEEYEFWVVGWLQI